MAHQAGQESLTPREQHQAPIGGQNHNRIAVSASQPDVDISIVAKMLSATLGSVLTSLLGKQPFPILELFFSNAHSVTPLDVVRVRLQSQHTSSPSPSTTASAIPRSTLPSPPQ